MGTSWALQDAKNRFDELVDSSLRDGPQIVTRRGTPVVVVMAADNWKQRGKPKRTLLDLFQNCPVKGIELDIARNPAARPEVKF